MEKAIKHIISLCILLLFGNGSLFAHTLASPFSATSISKSIPLEKSNKTGLEHLLDNQLSINNPIKDVYRKKEVLVENEEEDSEIITAKKVLEKTTYFTTFFNPQPTHFLSNYTNNSLAISKEIFHLPSYQSLYIIFEVFRI